MAMRQDRCAGVLFASSRASTGRASACRRALSGEAGTALAGGCGPGVFHDLEAELLDDRVGKHFARDAFDFGLRGGAVQTIQLEHKEFPLADVAHGGVSEGGQRLLDRGALRVENRAS